MASLGALAARKATFLLALILMASPVAGLRPMRAGRLRTWRMPRPLRRMRLPFFRCLVMSPTMPMSMALTFAFGRPLLSANAIARWRSVTVSAFTAFFTGAILGMLISAFCMCLPLLRFCADDCRKCIDFTPISVFGDSRYRICSRLGVLGLYVVRL